MSDIKQFQHSIKTLYNGQPCREDSGLKVQHLNFTSEIRIKSKRPDILQGDIFYHELVDHEADENNRFTYPVVLPDKGEKWNQCLVLLHGLNEKSWDKYLTWAGKLARDLNRPVLLFPIAYHMNRAPQSWSNPRAMKNVVSTRSGIKGSERSSFANAALSTRLSASPEQFVYSGIQSYYDVWQLLKLIQKGDHPLLQHDTKVDFFAYSIGAFLAEILFVSNPGKLLTDTRLFLFAGGPTFDTMQGNSKYIMDLGAFRRLLSLKRRKVLQPVYRHLREQGLPDFENCWNGFKAMLSMRKGRKMRQAVVKERGNRIYAIALEKDRVMPAKHIVQTLKGKRKNLPPRVDIIDFPYSYTHENPFPFTDDKTLPLVARSMEVVLNKAIRFYIQPVKRSARVEPAPAVQGEVQLA